MSFFVIFLPFIFFVLSVNIETLVYGLPLTSPNKLLNVEPVSSVKLLGSPAW
jgi:hypothetical protein